MNGLTLAIVNEGEDYLDRLHIARNPNVVYRANMWTGRAGREATKQKREFGDAYTAAQILECAQELEAYYARHLKEIDS